MLHTSLVQKIRPYAYTVRKLYTARGVALVDAP